MLRVVARLAVAAATLTAVAAVPVTALADATTTMTIVVGDPITLQNKLLVTVPITITCPAPLAAGFMPGFVNVTVEQASGKSVSHGSGGVSLVACDTTPQSFLVQVTPDVLPVASSPFHKGSAILMANSEICDNNFPQTCFFGSVGWVTVKLA